MLVPGAKPAGAADTSASAAQQAEVATAVVARLGDRAAGSYFDAASRSLVVNITDPSAAGGFRSAGVVPRVVRHSTAQLRTAMATLAPQARIAGTAWSIDPRQDRVVVTADPTVTGANRARLDAVVKALGDKVVLRHTASPFKPFVAGGDAIRGSGVRCSLGFNVSVNGAPYFPTAGHCGNASSTWSDSQGGGEIGQPVDSRLPGTDYALVQYDSSGTDHPSAVDLCNGSTQQITHAADAYVGEQVQRSGSTTDVYGGSVTGLDATVNYQEGSMSGLIDTDVCAEPGDSGGALFDGDAAIGLTSGGSGDCTSGGETFFQPVPAALNAGAPASRKPPSTSVCPLGGERPGGHGGGVFTGGEPAPADVSRQGDRASGDTVAPATARMGRRQESGGPRGTHGGGNRTCAQRARSRVSCI